MQQNSASFWADIKNYEELLAQDPDSYLFARLAEVYLKVNLVDDALHTARQGVAKYPAYIAGQRALAMACFAKGLENECRQRLESLAAAIPEDSEVQKILGRLLAAEGDCSAAAKAFRTTLVFCPDDLECLEELKALESAIALKAEQESGHFAATAELLVADEEIIDLDESDIVMESEAEETVSTPSAAADLHHDPLSTATLAELYVQQGFIDKALDIYRAVYAEDPTDGRIQSRIAELEAREAESEAVAVVSGSVEAPAGNTYQESMPSVAVIPVQGEADTVISTLEGWLDTIRRIKACR